MPRRHKSQCDGRSDFHLTDQELVQFRGMRDGLGRDPLTLDLERLSDGAGLVAIAGANGRDKTTVMDYMHLSG